MARDGGGYRRSRRELLGSGLAAAASLAVGLGTAVARPASALAQTAMTPDEAIAQLIAGNKRFQRQELASFKEDLKLLKQQTAAGQAPFAALLSCADSRVPVELVFDQTIGRLFVNRVAGNVATAEMIASLEYGVAVLGAKAIMVLGHSNCGAVQATIAGKPVPGQISTLYRSIRPAIDQAGPDLAAATKANARIQAGLLRTASPVFGELAGKGQLKIVAAYYDLASGVVTLLD